MSTVRPRAPTAVGTAATSLPLAMRGIVRSQPGLVVVLVVGLAARAVLIPITHGQDFTVWDLASRATLRGVNVYAHHPDYPGGPYAYFPLFLYLELPFQWLAQQTGLPFTVLGKIPIAAADLAVAVLIAMELHDRRQRGAVVAIGAALYFLNPLVLYNSAYYGRFDSLGCALLLLALRLLRGGSRHSAFWYAVAVAAKTFPGFVLAGVLAAARRARVRTIITLVLVLGVVSIPYLSTLPAYVHDIVVYDAIKPPQSLSWQRLLLAGGHAGDARIIGYVMLGAFVAGAIWLRTVVPMERHTVLVLVLFVLCSKVVLEQYLTWPLPWLVLGVWTSSKRSAAACVALIAGFTVAGMIANPSIHPWGRSPWWLDICVGAACAWFLVVVLSDATTRRRSLPS